MTEFQQTYIPAPIGVNFAREPTQLPTTTWDHVQNVSFRHGKVFKCNGYEQAFGSAQCKPEVIIPIRDSSMSEFWWSYAGEKVIPSPKWITKDTKHFEQAIFRVESKDVHTDVTPRNSSGESLIQPRGTIWLNNKWVGDEVNGTPYLLLEKPYVWNNDSHSYEVMRKFPDHVRFKSMRTFRNFMVGMNFYTDAYTPDADSGYSGWDEGIRQNGIWWSNDIGSSSLQVGADEKSLWLDADSTRNSGWNLLGGSGGPIVDGKTLRNSFIIYREGSVWSMDFVGGVDVFSFREMFDDDGVKNVNCIEEVDGQHFVIGNADIYAHNGVSKTSIADGVVRKAIFDSIDPDYMFNVFSTSNPFEKEFWVCIPDLEHKEEDFYNGGCTTAFVFNWEEKVWSKRRIPSLVSASYAALKIDDNTEDITWDAVSEGGPVVDGSGDTGVPGATWKEATDTWASSSQNYSVSNWGLVLGSNIVLFPGSGSKYLDSTFDWGGVLPIDVDEPRNFIFTSTRDPRFDTLNFEGVFEKRWMTMGDVTNTTFVNKIYPEVRGPSEPFNDSYSQAPIDVYIAGTQQLSVEPSYKFLGTFDPSLSNKLSCRCSGQYIHVKFVIPKTSRAELRGYTLEWSKIGRRS